MKKFNLKLVVTLCGIYLSILAFAANSVSITSSRLFLDPKAKTTSMRVVNNELEPKSCTVAVKNLDVVNGSLVLTKQNEGVNPNPINLVKLAPSRFELGVNKNQAFKAIYRRRPGLDAGEYIGAVAIKCTSTIVGTETVTIKPSLVHNVPIIVRTGELSANVNISRASLVNANVIFEFEVSGERSVTGDIEVVNAVTGDVLAKKENVSQYPNAPSKTIYLTLPDTPNQKLIARFTEIEESGTISVTRALN